MKPAYLISRRFNNILLYLLTGLLFIAMFWGASCEGPIQPKYKFDSLTLLVERLQIVNTIQFDSLEFYRAIMKDTTTWPYVHDTITTKNNDFKFSDPILVINDLGGEVASRQYGQPWRIPNAPRALNTIVRFNTIERNQRFQNEQSLYRQLHHSHDSIEVLTFELDAQKRYTEEMIAKYEARLDSAAAIKNRLLKQLENSVYNKPKN